MQTVLPSAAVTGQRYLWNGHLLIKTPKPFKFVIVGTSQAFREPGQFVNLGDANPVGPLTNFRV